MGLELVSKTFEIVIVEPLRDRSRLGVEIRSVLATASTIQMRKLRGDAKGGT